MISLICEILKKIQQTREYNNQRIRYTDTEKKTVVNQWAEEKVEPQFGLEKSKRHKLLCIKINKLQGYTRQHREHSQYFIIAKNGV